MECTEGEKGKKSLATAFLNFSGQVLQMHLVIKTAKTATSNFREPTWLLTEILFSVPEEDLLCKFLQQQ